MGVAPTEPPGAPAEDRLDSWKEIAAYLKRDVTTVQRWEKRESMPVHRHRHDKMGSVYAFRSELDAWAGRRDAHAVQDRCIEESSPSAQPDAARFRWQAAIGLLVVVGAVVAGARFWLQRNEIFWRNPAADVRVQSVTDFDGHQQAGAISPDGRFAAFLSDRDGRTDVWVTRIGSGLFHNLTAGSAPELVNPSVRTLRFTPDGDSVAYWVRRPGNNGTPDIGIWSVPTLGGTSIPYLSDAAEFDWTRDGSRLVYHTTGPGDPMFVTSDARESPGAPIFTAPAGLHAHFPIWSADGAFIYFVQGRPPDKMDIWRITPKGGGVERITRHDGRVSHPVLFGDRTLLYLASDAEGNGPWLYSIDIDKRIPHRIITGAEHYTSLSASASGDRLLVTVARQKRTLWRLPLADALEEAPVPRRIDLATGTGFSPRLGPDYLVYVASSGGRESLWKLAGDRSTRLWSGADDQVIGAPAISPDGHRIAFSVKAHGRSAVNVMQADGSDARLVTDKLSIEGALAWTPDGHFITCAALDDHGTPRLMKVPLDGSKPSVLVQEYSTDPSWSADGSMVVYSGPDIGTAFSVKSATPAGSPKPIPPLTLTRGARHVTFLPGHHALLVLRGEIQHKNLWLVDLDTGRERALTDAGADFDITDFDVSRDGGEVILERSQESADIALLSLRGGR